MKAGDWFLLAMSVGYLGAAIAYYFNANKGYALALTAYAIANVGLIHASR